MIIRKRKKPRPLQKLKALIPRLHPNHPNLESIKIDAAKRYKGYIGEQKVDYHLERIPMQHTIAHDVQLTNTDQKFQIDSLILTKKAIYIIETKNFDGTITFDTNLHQLIREQNTKEEGFDYPITQAENTKHQLQTWLAHKNIHNIPIHYFIVISEPSTIIRVHGNEQQIAKCVTHAANLNQKIQATEKTIQNTNWNHRKIGNIIHQECQDFDFNILRKHGITPHDILPGTQCPNCQNLGMTRHYAKWQCTKCQHTSKHAHRKTINDYLLLKKPYITNKDCRHFLQIHSRSTATRLLQSAKLSYDKKRQIWQKK